MANQQPPRGNVKGRIGGARRPAPPDDEADDEESDYDDRPRGQRERKSSLPLVLVLVLVGFVGLVGIGVTGYL